MSLVNDHLQRAAGHLPHIALLAGAGSKAERLALLKAASAGTKTALKHALLSLHHAGELELDDAPSTSLKNTVLAFMEHGHLGEKGKHYAALVRHHGTQEGGSWLSKQWHKVTHGISKAATAVYDKAIKPAAGLALKEAKKFAGGLEKQIMDDPLGSAIKVAKAAA